MRTPGLWKQGGHFIAATFGQEKIILVEAVRATTEDLRLIAAAPDLLSALGAMLESARDANGNLSCTCADTYCSNCLAQRAIKQATGR